MTKTIKTVSFKCTREDTVLIGLIVMRAKNSLEIKDLLSLTMDITATHCNGCKLDLGLFLAADDFNFIHDIAGISRHINRKTGELEDCFLPRCAR